MIKDKPVIRKKREFAINKKKRKPVIKKEREPVIKKEREPLIKKGSEPVIKKERGLRDVFNKPLCDSPWADLHGSKSLSPMSAELNSQEQSQKWKAWLKIRPEPKKACFFVMEQEHLAQICNLC